MTCRTKGCEFESPSDDPERRFCERCGWPLAQGHVSWTPETLNFEGTATARLTVRVDNETGGTLDWRLLDLPAGVQRISHERAARVGQEATTELEIDPSMVAAERLSFTVRVFDRAGTRRGDLRTGSPDETARDLPVEIPLIRRRRGPLTCDWNALVFGGRVGKHHITLHNHGETSLDVTLQVRGPYTVSTDVMTPQASMTQAFMPHESRIFTVTRASGNTTEEGTLEITAAGLPPLAVRLVPVVVERAPLPNERYLIAIDFGTSKSAVMVLDQHAKPAVPKPLLWAHHGEQHRWVPSVVALDESDQPKRFGWEVGDTESGPRIIRQLKTRLGENSALINDCVTFFLRRIFDRIAEQFDQDDVFSDCRILVTLPVLDNGARYEAQKQSTVALVTQVAREYRVAPESVHTAKEPECAAIDFLQVLQAEMSAAPAGRMIQEGDWLCILDMGGGTTDVTFAQLALSSSGQPTFDQMHSVGFPFAGDEVDEKIYAWCTEAWLRKNRLKRSDEKRGASKKAVEELASADLLQLEGEPLALPRSEAMQMVRVLKEAMYRSDTPLTQALDAFVKTPNHLTIAPDDLGPMLQELSDRMFVQGTGAYPSVRDALERTLRLPARDVSLLCITGGTGNIPDFRKHLRRVLTRSDMREVVTRQEADQIRLNVVRGAAQSGVVQMGGRLPFDIRVDLGGAPWRALESGCVPGIRARRTTQCEPGMSSVIRVVALPAQKPPLALMTKTLTHDEEDALTLEVELEYTSIRQLRLGWRWLRGEGAGWSYEPLQTVPHV